MKTKHQIKQWLLITIMTFFLYDVIWLAGDYDDFSRSVLNHSSEIIEDFVYCSLFSLTSIFICNQLIKLSEKRQHITNKQLTGMAWYIVFINIILALICEFIYEDVICNNPPDDDCWGNSYIFALIASFIGLINVNHYYTKIVESYYNEYISFKKKSLKAQLNPHFLFNSLSVLTELTRENGTKAEEFTLRLANVYRHVLKTIDMDLVPLSEAILFARNYTDILHVRFGESVVFRIAKFPINSNEYMLPMSIQLLVENAIKHNFASRESPLIICIDRKDDKIIVSNNMQSCKDDVARISFSLGIGLQNLQQRYILETGTGIDIRECNTEFKVYIPIIEK
jgi:two component system sensor histidine kinase